MSTSRTRTLNNRKRRIQFGYNKIVPFNVGGAVFQYLCKSLVRHTRTAEEAFYNILRVANTSEMIYAEDAVLNLQLTEPTDKMIVRQAKPGKEDATMS